MSTSEKLASPRVELPGFGLPRNESWGHSYNTFPHALLNEGRGELSKGVFLRERRMLDFIGTITDKPDWSRKVFDDTIIGKWKDEAKNMPPVDDDDVYMSDAMFDNCIAELRDKATRLAAVGFVSTLDAELSIVKSDQAVSDDLVANLRRCVAFLEDVPDREKDWHPGSGEQVLDLLHPSLFPVVFGRTLALRSGTVPLDDCVAYTGKGELTRDTPAAGGIYQDLYQWLPSCVTVTDSGASITSYINNLHPRQHKELYGVLEKFVAAAVPLWEECLSWWEDRRRFKVDRTDDDADFYVPEGITYQVPCDDGNGFHGDGNGDADSTGSVDSDYLWTEEYMDWKEEHRILMFPEPADYVPFEKQVDLSKRVDLRAQFPDGLQVIFKLANIHLTPEKPEYAGGTWHVEGTLSEQICATALYYYDEENITPSRLSFRQSIDEDEMIMLPAQSAFTSLEKYFGVENEGIAAQELGSVLTRPGRLLAFPNVLQHRVGSFQLQDATKPGHRKILAMFLIDPQRRVLSTANVPPQRKDWWSVLVRDIPVFARLPLELFTHIIDLVDTFPLSWNEASDIRADLMAERSAFTEQQEDEINEHVFSFCEH